MPVSRLGVRIGHFWFAWVASDFAHCPKLGRMGFCPGGAINRKMGKNCPQKMGPKWGCGHIIGDKAIICLTFAPDELFEVIACVLCVHKRESREIDIDLPNKNLLT